MQYALLIYGYEPESTQPGTAEFADELKAYDAFGAEAGERIRGGAALHASHTATTLRGDGERMTTDGPYAETREQLGGFYLLECADLDEAVAWADKLPHHPGGAIEVRPVMELP